MKTEGSIIVMVLFVVMVCTGLGIKRLFESSLMLDVIKKREQQEQIFRLNDALATYGTEVCIHDFNRMLRQSKQEPVVCSVTLDNTCTGTIIVTNKDDISVYLVASITYKKCISTISCCLTSIDDKFLVSAWSYEKK